MAGGVERGERRRLGDPADDVVFAAAAQCGEQFRLSDRVADPQPGQGVGLGEGAQPEHAPAGQLAGPDPVGGRLVFGVGTVDHQQGSAPAAGRPGPAGPARPANRPSGCRGRRGRRRRRRCRGPAGSVPRCPRRCSGTARGGPSLRGRARSRRRSGRWRRWSRRCARPEEGAADHAEQSVDAGADVHVVRGDAERARAAGAARGGRSRGSGGTPGRRRRWRGPRRGPVRTRSRWC